MNRIPLLLFWIVIAAIFIIPIGWGVVVAIVDSCIPEEK